MSAALWYSHVRRKVVLSGGGNEVTEHEAELMEAQTSPGHFFTELHSSARLSKLSESSEHVRSVRPDVAPPIQELKIAGLRDCDRKHIFVNNILLGPRREDFNCSKGLIT